MKSSMLVLLALAVVACAEKVLVAEAPAAEYHIAEHTAAEQTTAFGYLTKYAIPLGEKLRKAEEEYLQKSQRIVGGSPTSSKDHPYAAGILIQLHGIDGTGVCSGSLVSRSRVLTAAHCWYDGMNQAWQFEIVLGSSLLFSGGSRHTTSAVAVHPDWFPFLVRNDVAVAYLPWHVEPTDTIAPVALPQGSELFETFEGETAVATGFGLTADNAGISNGQFLSHVSMNVISTAACKLAFPLFIHDSNICTSGVSGGPCSGDSGGPLVLYRNNKALLIGATSFGSGFGCESWMPAAYARVTDFVGFINQHLCEVDC